MYWCLTDQTALAEAEVEYVRAYEFHIVYHSVVDFCAQDLSALYFDILKDRLYTSKRAGKARRSAQTVLYEVARDLLRLLAPVMSFTAEEAWQLLPGKTVESVFLAGMPQEAEQAQEAELSATYEKLFAVRSQVLGHLEAARRNKLIGASLEAKVVLAATGEAQAFLKQHLAELPSIFIVSQVELAEAPGPKGQPLELAGTFGEAATVHAEVQPADGQKCPRCWTYSTHVAQGADVCEKCAEALA